VSVTNDPRIGRAIDGRYVVTRLVGKGGMGAVYEAREGERTVAIKFLAAGDAQLRARFRREARLARDVDAENVVRVLDNGDDYIVMEYVAGSDLERLLASEKALSIDRAVAITSSILDGLAAIHDRGIVHRDVKPSNVFVTGDTVKLGDFGLARGPQDATLTASGHVVGTTPFMAPEVFRGETVDHRADLYAVGITLYQMLAGKLPFVGPTAEIGALHVYSPPPPLEAARPDVPPWLVAIVARALAKSPLERYSSARELRAALEARGGTREPRRARWPYIIAALAVAAGALIGAVAARC